MKRNACWWVATLCTVCSTALGGQKTYPIGAVGGRAEVVEQQGGAALVVRSLNPGMPGALAGLHVGDRIVSVNGKALAAGYLVPLKMFGEALDASQSKAAGLVLTLGVARGGKTLEVSVKMPRGLGSFGENFPDDCPKALMMYEQACANMAEVYQSGKSLPGGEVTNMLGAMALLGHREGKYDEVVKSYVMSRASAYQNDPDGGGSVWLLSYSGILLCEYYSLYPQEKEVEQAILTIAQRLNKHIPDHGRYGHGLRIPDKNAVAYDGQGLNATTSAALWFFASAARAGIEPAKYRPAFLKALARIRKETNRNGGVGYAWGGDTQSSMRSGHTGLALFHIIEGGLLDDEFYRGAEQAGASELDELYKYARTVGTWPSRHPVRLLEAHAVSSMGLAAATASLAAWDPPAYKQLMQQWRWWFALSHEPKPLRKGKPLAYTFGYVGGPNNTGGDFYLNGHRELDDPALFNSIQHATVGFVLASTQRRLSFFGGLPSIKQFTAKDMLHHSTLLKAYELIRHHRGRYGDKTLYGAMVLLQPLLREQLPKASVDIRKTQDPQIKRLQVELLLQQRLDQEVVKVPNKESRLLARKLNHYADERTVALEFAELKKTFDGPDKYLAQEAVKAFRRKHPNLERYQEITLPMKESLQTPEMQALITAGRQYHHLRKLLERNPKMGRELLERYVANEPTQHYYVQAARKLLETVRADGSTPTDAAGASAVRGKTASPS